LNLEAIKGQETGLSQKASEKTKQGIQKPEGTNVDRLRIHQDPPDGSPLLA